MKKFDMAQSITVAANVGVIIGIVFLAIEIRSNTIATEAASIQLSTDLDQSFLMEVGSDKETARVWTTYIGAPVSLSDAERAQGTLLFAAVIRRLENTMLLYELGAISEDGWNSRRPLFVGVANSPGFATYRETRSARFSSREIMDYLDQLRVPTE